MEVATSVFRGQFEVIYFQQILVVELTMAS